MVKHTQTILGNSRQIVWVWLTILWGLCLKGEAIQGFAFYFYLLCRYFYEDYMFEGCIKFKEYI